MKSRVLTCVLLSACSCAVFVNGPDKEPSSSFTPENGSHQSRTSPFFTGTFFPFQNNFNWWRYTESEGNQLSIHVTDTISDNGTTYFRVSFQENQVDTTDDWFKHSSSGIFFGQSLVGSYNLFLPERIDSLTGSFDSGGYDVAYTFHDTLTIQGTRYRRVLVLEYDPPMLHGFDELAMADSIGIIEMIDHHSRWPVTYSLDSCFVDGAFRKF